jgi:hypothetical protein
MSADADTHDQPGPAHDEQAGHAHAGIHLPPNSFVPVNVALALSLVFVGFLSDIRATIGPAMWLVGLAWLIAACGWWVVTSRREYESLPEDQQH